MSLSYDLEQQLYTIINNNPLPIDIKYYIIKNVYGEVVHTFEQFIEEERQQEKKEKEQEEEQQQEEISQTPQVEVTDYEDGSVAVTATGTDLGETLSAAIQATQPINQEDDNK